MVRRFAVAASPLVIVALISAQDGGPGVVRTGNLSPIIDNLDRSLAF